MRGWVVTGQSMAITIKGPKISVTARLNIVPDGAMVARSLVRLLTRVYHWSGVWLQAAQIKIKIN